MRIALLASGFLILIGNFAHSQTTPRSIVRESDEPRRWSLLIGVNDYINVNDLKYCDDDVEGLRERLEDNGFDAKQQFLLRTSSGDTAALPLKPNIEKHLALLLGALTPDGRSLQSPGLVGKDDLVVVAFSGHGVNIDGKSFLCPIEADLGRPSSLISLDKVYDWLEACPARFKLLLVDACRNDPNPGGEKAMRATTATNDFARSLENPPKGILVLSSCASGQVSLEDESLGHGVFMHFLLEGLTGKADSEKGDRNGRVSLLELYKYAADKTKFYVADTRRIPQTPALRGEIVGDFEFGKKQNIDLSSFVNSVGMKLVKIPAGEFLMGSSRSAAEIARVFDSKNEYLDPGHPQHRVRISRSFYLGSTEVTQGQWESVMGRKPGNDASLYREGWNIAASYVNWKDATEFCRRLGAKEGRTYRLPTEAEWEYACRAGTTTMYSFDDNASQLDRYAWYDENTDDIDDRYAHRVGAKLPNAWGLYDMHGNVFEWCADWYGEDYYGKSPREDPLGPTSGSSRVLRGGAWRFGPRPCCSASRFAVADAGRLDSIGFRVVCEID